MFEARRSWRVGSSITHRYASQLHQRPHLSRTRVLAHAMAAPLKAFHGIVLPLFPLARVIKTTPGYIARKPHNIKDKYAKGIYSLACNERWPQDMQHALLQCKRIDAALKGEHGRICECLFACLLHGTHLATPRTCIANGRASHACAPTRRFPLAKIESATFHISSI